MKIPRSRIIASTLAAAVVLGFGFGVRSMATPQAPAPAGGGAPPKAAARGGGPNGAAAANATARGAAGAIPPWTALHASPQTVLAHQQQQQQQAGQTTPGIWAEVISSTQRWIVVQNQDGQQFPIAGDRIRQFLIRWPSRIEDITASSMVEATGMQTASNAMMTDHLDIYETDAQSLVTPTLQSVMGPNQGGAAGQAPGYGNTSNFSFINFESLNFGSLNWTEMPSAGAVNWTDTSNVVGGNSVLLHVVGRSTSNNPVQLTGFGPSFINVFGPGGSTNGMSVTQITLGAISYAKKGDVVHLVPEAASPRGLDVSQLVLYKKIPLSRFQP